MKIFLVGFMGCGKSYVARSLAPKLNMEVVDLDQFIVEQTGRSIPEIFEKEGEAAFRNIEQAQLHRLGDCNNTIISTGGGAACFFDNMEWMNAQGITVFLDVSVPLLVERLQTSKTKRPLIEGKNTEELEMFIAKKLAIRRPFYEQAQLIQFQNSAEQDRVELLVNLLKTKTQGTDK